MKRDIDLVRKILLELEKKSQPWAAHLALEGYDHEVVSYHIMLLSEANYITAFDASSNDGIDWMPERMTWAGHDFLDAARNDTLWNKAKQTIGEKVGSVSFEVLKATLAALAAASIGLS